VGEKTAMSGGVVDEISNEQMDNMRRDKSL
jgi:hypothetical protein